MPTDVADDLPHVRKIVVRKLALLLAEDCNDAPTAGVSDAFTRAVTVLAFPAYGTAFLGSEPLFQFRHSHVHRVVEILADLFTVQIRHAWTTRVSAFRSVAFDELAALDHRIDVLEHGDVRQRIALHCDDIA